MSRRKSQTEWTVRYLRETCCCGAEIDSPYSTDLGFFRQEHSPCRAAWIANKIGRGQQ